MAPPASATRRSQRQGTPSMRRCCFPLGRWAHTIPRVSFPCPASQPALSSRLPILLSALWAKLASEPALARSGLFWLEYAGHGPFGPPTTGLSAHKQNRPCRRSPLSFCRGVLSFAGATSHSAFSPNCDSHVPLHAACSVLSSTCGSGAEISAGAIPESNLTVGWLGIAVVLDAERASGARLNRDHAGAWLNERSFCSLI
jgi:hypothetical protein